MSRTLPTLRTWLSHEARARTRLALSSFLGGRVRRSHTMSLVPRGSYGFSGFVLGLGSSAAAFAAATYTQVDLQVLKPSLATSSEPFISSERPDFILTELASILPHVVVRSGKELKQTYGIEGAAAAVQVRSTEDVVKIVDVARSRKIPLVTRYTAGEMAEESSVPVGAILVDLSGMNRVLHVHAEDGDLVCQASATWDDVDRRLKDDQLSMRIPFDPGRCTTVGDVISSGSAGGDYNWLLNVSAVMPDGSTIKTQRRARNPASGMDTTKIFVGTQGTLGIVTEVTMRLAPVTPTKIGVAQIDDVSSVMSAVMDLLNNPQGAHIQSVNFIDDNAISAFNATHPTAALPAHNSLVFTFAGTEPAIRQAAATVKSVLKQHHDGRSIFTISHPDVAQAWESVAHPRSESVGGVRVRQTSVSVPVSHLPEILVQAKAYFEKAKLKSGWVGNLKNGHFRSTVYLNGDEEPSVVNDAIVGLVHRVLALDGSCTGDNGVGANTKDYVVEELGPDTVRLMRTIKAAVDPDDIMNPHKQVFNVGES